MSKHRISLALLGVVVLAASALWLLRGGAAAQGFLPYTDDAIVAQGQTVYARACASCHGAQLEGQADWRAPDAAGYLPAPPHDPTGHTWHHADKLLFGITKFGTEAIVGNGYRSNMAGFGDQLSDTEIVAVLAYVKSTWPDRVIAAHNQINAQSD